MDLQATNQTLNEQMPLGSGQQDLSNIRPVSSEIGFLWTSYLAESMSICMLKFSVAKATDNEIRSILQHALDVSSQRVQIVEKIFNSIHHPIPTAFGEEDVDISAKNLFNDSFWLSYTRLMHKLILVNYSQSLGASYRPDIFNYFNSCIDTSQEIIQKTNTIIKAKGIWFHSPYIDIPQKIDTIQTKKYIKFLNANSRPINAIELGHIISVLENTMLIRNLDIAFSQVVRSEAIKKQLIKAIEIGHKQIDKLEAVLDHEDIPIPSMIDFIVSDSKEPPFSDKLMLSHSAATAAFMIAADGLAIPSSMRIDLVTYYRNYMTDLLDLAKDGAQLLIENGWLERIPETANRQKLRH